jgi:sugar lactone lactonase YvrE
MHARISFWFPFLNNRTSVTPRRAEASQTHPQKQLSKLHLERLEDRMLLAAVAPSSGVVSWWTGDGTAADLVGPNTGTLNNGAGFATGNVGSGFNFDGVDDNLQAPTAGLPTGSADRTIELWARIDQQVTGEAFFASYGAPGSNSQVYTLGTVSDRRVFVSTWGPAIFGPALQNGQWYNVGRSFKLYLDGAEVASGSMDVNTPANSTFWMGRQTMTSIGDTRRLDGMVDEVTVYNRALSASEIQAIYDAGSDGKIKSATYLAADFPSVVEGQAGSATTATFTVSRVGNLTGQVIVEWTTTNATASAASDYVAASGQLTFEDGESQKTVDITVNGDDTPESNETFQLILSTTAPGYAVGAGQATIQNDDAAISVNDVAATEGDTTVVPLGSFATASSGLARPYAMIVGPDGNLYVSDRDSHSVLRYEAGTGNPLPAPGKTGAEFVSPDSGGLNLARDIGFGPDGSLCVVSEGTDSVLRYDAISGAFLGTLVASGAGGLDDPRGLLFHGAYVYVTSVGTETPSAGKDSVLRFDAVTGEPAGLSGVPGDAVFIPSGSGGLDNPSRIVFGPDGNAYVSSTATTANSPTANSILRYDAATGTPAGISGQPGNAVFVSPGSGGLDGPVAMIFRPDGLYVTSWRNHNVLRYDVSSGAFAGTVVSSFSSGLITPFDLLFESSDRFLVSSNGNHQILRFGAASQAVFTVSLSFASAIPVTVDYETADGTAAAGSDYEQTSGTLTFAAGETTKTVLVRTLAEESLDADEMFVVNLANPSTGGTIADGQGSGTILDPGFEIHVNSTTAGPQVTTLLPINFNPGQTNQAVASDSAGNFVVAWSGNGIGDSEGIFFQRYDSSRNPLGGETRANVTTANPQTNAVVGRAASNGKYVIAWNSNNGVYGRVFNANGSVATGELTIAAGSSSTQNYIDSIAVDADGDFVVLYRQFVQKGIGESRYWQAQRFNAAGQSQGGSIRVTTLGLINGQGGIAGDWAGNFVVVWDDGGVNAQRYNNNGKKVGPQILVLGSSGGIQGSNVGRDADGDFVVTWGNNAQVFNNDGTRRGGILTFPAARGESIAVQANGNFVLSWTQGSSTTNNDIYAQRFDLNGAALESPRRVNQTLALDQENASVAVASDGDYVVAWSTPKYRSNVPNTTTNLESDVVARRFDAPAALTAARGAAPTQAAPSTSGLELQVNMAEAITRWKRTGLSSQQRNALDNVQIGFADLGGATLGLASGHTIWLDDNAAGWGWFVDPTPGSDREFRTPGDQGERDHVDLLTALAHEMGHVLGLNHDAGDIMRESLATGERLTPPVHDRAIAQVLATDWPTEVNRASDAIEAFFGLGPKWKRFR